MTDDPSTPQSTPPPGSAPRPSRAPVASLPAEPATAPHGRGAWLAAALLLVVPVGIAYLRKSSGDTAGALAYAMGTAIGIVFLAALGAALFRAITRRGSVPAPLALGVAALLGIGAQFVLRERSHAEHVEASAAISDCSEESPDPLAKPPPGMELAALSPSEEASFAARIETSLPGWSGRYIARMARVGGQPAGFVVAYPGITALENGVEQFKEGAVSAVNESGGTIDEQVIGGETALVGSAPGMGVLAVTHGCWAVTVIGPNAQAVSGIASGLLRSPTG